ncbi:MAG: DUF805 domain-containing protein [Ruminococcus sp.]|nr:DUF805 domain-containing protein [Ruminococcus sp.]
MKKCNQCGAAVNDSALFCTVCGCRLSANDDVVGKMPGTEDNIVREMPGAEDDFDSGATTVLNDNPYAQSQPIKNESTVYTPQPSSNYYQQNPNNYRNPAPQQSSVNYAQGGQAYGNSAPQQQYQNPYQPAMGYVPNAKKNPIKAYADFWKNYANFNGRARRSDYWYVALAEAVIGMVFGILAGIIIAIVYNVTWDDEVMAVVGAIAGGILGLYSLATIVPHLSLTVRRLHDIGKGGVYLLLGLIPGGIGNIIILVFCCTDSQPGINQYGTSEKYPQLQQNNAYAQQGMYR